MAAIVERLRPLLHIDPVAVLPPEITSEIFSYLSPTTLLEASRASRTWRERALDSRLWRQKFRSEGWSLDIEAVRRFEQSYRQSRKTRSRRADAHAEQRRQKRRARVGTHLGEGVMQRQRDSTEQQEPRAWNNQHGDVEADEERTLIKQESVNDEEMQDVDSSQSDDSPYLMEVQPTSQPRSPSFTGQSDTQNVLEQRSPSHLKFETGVPAPVNTEQSLVRYNSFGVPQINYNNVYKQKRRLEQNWDSGQYQSFQLPHRDHPEEAHIECVYTIQYIGKYLVSGSRDRTLRKWDLDTQRLIGKPLVGHNGSVLCLQFDTSDSEDIIISGSSDTDVILWRYSTGRMLKKIPHAHEESVLNLKFDSRFLVTCSKDKTIKLWNRRELRPGDRDYPISGVEGGGFCPSYILDLRHLGNSIDINRHLTADEKTPLEPYTTLMILGAHNAAVNAIHIYEDQLVSASGDRHVHVWNIHTGVRTAICRGHTKGIACVQYDGKRIVSGSSDNTIRIYDPVTQAEVACLKGHTRLVRTIQSAFGDLPGTKDQLEAEALEIDAKFLEARRAGQIPLSSKRGRERNAGSKDPKHIMAYGAKLPPGGGGSKWGRIVSGSYDETIIIWKKLADGRWAKAHVLRQEEALRAAGGPLLSQSDLNSQAHTGQAQQQQQHHHHHHHHPQQQGHIHQHPTTQAVHNLGDRPQHLQHRTPTPHHHQVPTQPSSGPSNSSTTSQTHSSDIPTEPQTNNNNHSDAQHAAAAATTMHGTLRQQPSLPHIPLHQQQQQQHHHQLVGAQSQQTQQITQRHHHAQPPPPPPQGPHQQQQQQQQQQQPPPRFTAPVSQPNARVFKLQFDARRIVCCSQDPKIVGWDFANGDEKIIECSPFFATPQ